MYPRLQYRLNLTTTSFVLICLLISGLNVNAANTPCIDVGGTIMCEGDQSEGVNKNSGPYILNVFNLSADIEPASGVAGISFSSQGANGSNRDWDYFEADDGGSGKNGDGLTASFSGAPWEILTEGERAQGILVQSHAGKGGSGGDGYGVAILGVGYPGVGGDGGKGGSGGAIGVSSEGDIITYGKSAHGIYGYSLGGKSGNGGDGYSVNLVLGLFAGFGGDAGKGGSGGSVSITNDGRVTTHEVSAHGIYAFSQAGDGGNGGDGEHISTSLIDVYGKGGDGGVGGTGGSVTVNNKGPITTFGAESLGIVAQSFGGEGGDGGSISGVIVGTPGSGMGSGPGGNVTLINTGLIQTYGEKSRGILAQSVGGFAGTGGADGGLISYGASGGSAGNGGKVFLTNIGRVTTEGAGADAITAQSSGGGGGVGGESTGGLFSLGGEGGAGGDGGEVSVVNEADLKTAGTAANGIYAGSTGGGGGDGGDSISGFAYVSVAVGGKGGSGGDGGKVSVESNASKIETLGNSSYGIQAHSEGGGGGNGGFAISAAAGDTFALSVAKGGSGGAGGDGGIVQVFNSSTITTAGDDAPGISAQSLGGGGGSGGFSISLAGSTGYSFAVSVGGSGGDGGDGSSVDVGNELNPISGGIFTSGVRSSGIQALSTGGGGGTGGFSISAAGAVADSVSFSLGGSGGGGGSGGDVGLYSNSDITTIGGDAHGIYAESIGGGGGSGGFSVAGGLSVSGAPISISIGGAGGSGGDGGNVVVGSELAPIMGDILTYGEHAAGIMAKSTGKSGGHGGFSVAGGMNLTSSGALSFSLGGGGGSGGIGGNVGVNSLATIMTEEAYGYGIFAESKGGSGGSGAFSVAGGITSDGGINLSIGGAGGDGGIAGDVNVSSSGTIVTAGDHASGIQAQSTGGNGGNGGFSVAGMLNFRSGGTNIDVSVGGGGGDGSLGGLVAVDNSGEIDTRGDDASGIFAQSIGRNGGKGGFSGAGSLAIGSMDPNIGTLNLTMSFGGAGGDGNVGGDVNVSNSGFIRTEGSGSYGVFAQSLGGGGGAGGNSLTGLIGASGASKGSVTNLSTSVGGQGGNGNDGGTIMVNNLGMIETSGYGAHGVYAQSIGGGGGDGGNANAFSLILDKKSANSKNNVNLAIAVGGDGGGASDGGSLDVTNSGDIITHEAGSNGIMAQSVGGGGGNGGNGTNGLGLGLYEGLAEDLIGDHYSNVDSNNDLQINLGGDGGSSGNGGEVYVTNSGNITTYGKGFILDEGEVVSVDAAGGYGILAQSVGGGGGTAIARGGDANVGLFGKIGIGGGAGTSGDGGEVVVTHSGQLMTSGLGAHAIVAQSVGGGGGIAGDVNRIPNPFTDESLGTSPLFGDGGENGGNGASVDVQSMGIISTVGHGAFGILAQSVGGGGGIVNNPGFDGIPLGHFFGTVAGRGSGGMVTVEHSGDIVTLGDGAHGIFAQSAGGTSGSVTRDEIVTQFDGYSSAIDVTLRGNIITQGKDSFAILAQSIGDDASGDVNIIIESGSVQGGSAAGAGVKFLDGKDNFLFNHGTVLALSGNAVIGGEGNEVIKNYGTLIGNIELGEGINLLTNHAGALLNSGNNIVLGVNHLLNNSGNLSPGGLGIAQITSLTGKYIQTQEGTLSIDVDLAHDLGDRLEVSSTAELAGKLSVSAMSGYAKPGSHEQVVLSAEGTITDNTLELTAPSSAVVSYDLLQLNQNEIAIRSEVDFNPAQSKALSSNARSVAKHVNAIQNAGGSESFAPIAEALVAQPDDKSLNTAYEHLIPESLGTLSTETAVSSIAFNDAMHSCRKRDGAYRFVSEGECSWFRIDGGKREQDDTYGNPGYDLKTFTVAGGVQDKIGTGTHFGVGLSFQRSALNATITETKGEQLEMGFIVKHQSDAIMLSGSASFGYGTYDTERTINLPSPGVIAESNQKMYFQTIHGRISRDFEQGSSRYLRLLMDIGAIHTYRGEFTEKGANGANLHVESENDTFVTLQPMVEFGGEISLSSGTVFRPYFRVGATHFLTGYNSQVTAAMESAPNSIPSFIIKTENDRTYADYSLHADLIDKRGINYRYYYAGQYSKNSNSDRVGVKISIPF